MMLLELISRSLKQASRLSPDKCSTCRFTGMFSKIFCYSLTVQLTVTNVCVAIQGYSAVNSIRLQPSHHILYSCSFEFHSMPFSFLVIFSECVFSLVEIGFR